MLKIRQEEGPFSTLRVAAAKRRVETTESKQSRHTHTHTHTQEALGGYLPTREGGRRKYTVKRRQFPGSRQVGWLGDPFENFSRVSFIRVGSLSQADQGKTKLLVDIPLRNRIGKRPTL